MARRSYTLEFKQSTARLVREQGYSIAKAAEGLGVDPGSIRDWAPRRRPPPLPAPPPTSCVAKSSGSAPRTDGS